MTVNEMIDNWSKLKVSDNPYGNPIPDKYLTDDILSFKDGLPFKDRIQNGKLSQGLIKIDEAENTNYVVFSVVFDQCKKENKLCISNYLSKIISSLELRNLPEYIIRGYMARAIRSFASFLRELNLKDIVYDYFSQKGYDFSIVEDNHVNEDTKNKTDIFLKIKDDKYIYDYRIWSFQTTDKGLINTSRRLKSPSNGIHILLPLNIGDRSNLIEVNTWYLYDYRLAFRMIDSLKGVKEGYDTFAKQLLADNSVLKFPHKFTYGLYKNKKDVIN